MSTGVMIPLVDWSVREWSFDLPVGAFPAVLERLVGTPARAADLVAGVADEELGARRQGRWSVKDHLGHLDDLHALDCRRLDEFRARAKTLSAADPENRRTESADHASAPVDEILARFRRHRAELVSRLRALSRDDIAASSLHPRLGQPMRLVDWAQLVADHDDHHLARAREELGASS